MAVAPPAATSWPIRCCCCRWLTAGGALVGASILLLIASRYAVPLSTTHAIVGGVVGMTIAMSGSKCLTWKHPEKGVKKGLAGIVLSWVISPVVAGIIAVRYVRWLHSLCGSEDWAA